ncbi:MAG: neutral/alkaline non-lysosomal ceramidase N-terminal domain-containing protein [Verrucomicrobia subdivision 3 bacterium]|nr:neutral/alkaline non-lysosomal ceramidase N-terminal domain-containing protein [Limisphaerales bacterium]
MRTRTFTCLTIGLIGLLSAAPVHGAGEMKVGVGKVVITPKQDMWLAGYASRTRPSEGKLHDLYAKALALEDETGARTVLVTSDLIGVPAALVNDTANRAREKFQLPRERLMVTVSHTHTGPVLQDRLQHMYGLNETQTRLLEAYSKTLPDLFLQAIASALNDLQPCRVEWGVGRAGFAVNRRQYTPGGVINGANPIGPVDHDVPVMKISRADGSIKAVVHGYACHNTTLNLQKFSGDYAGFSQVYLEAKLPGATALFVCGCGGDANPLPRGTVEHAQKYGTELAEAVLAAARQPLTDLKGPIRAAFKEVSLALSPPPPRAEVEKQLQDSNVYVQRRAQLLLKTLHEKGALPTTYPYPVQAWQFADGMQMIALGGEVVVDYSLRLKYELGRERTWVIAYANDVCAYMPSLRVLREGGYEGAESMIYYGHHGPWAPAIEENIIGAVHELARPAKK